MGILTALGLSAVMASGQVNAGQTILRSVQIESGPDSVIVTMHASGPLPLPRVGVLSDPARIYLDLAGVAPATSGNAQSPDALVRGVRVAVNQPDPLVTRVVIDLSRPASRRVDVSQRSSGRIRVVVGDRLAADVRTPSSADTPPVPRATPTRPARPIENARANAPLAAAAAQLERLRPLLTSIDARNDVPEASLRDALNELAALRQILANTRASEAQDVLLKACVLATAAVDARIDAQQRADSARAWNAASAAAGALMMLDRVPKPTVGGR